MADIPKKLKLILRRVHHPALVLILYGILAIALLSPMASTSTISAQPDVLTNLGHIVQAKMALDEGQLPIRVAPWQYQGWQYPVFQFYGQFLYTWAGIIAKLFAPANPLLTLLILLWSALVTGGFFIYSTSLQLVRSQIAAILFGVAYMTAPYLMVNIHSRGAIAESVAQGILPVVLYCVVNSYTKPRRRYVLAGAVAWFCLIGTHTITFTYLSLFLIVWIGLASINGLRKQPLLTVRSLLRPFLSYLLGCLLAAYYLAPVILQTGLQIRILIGNPFETNGLTPLLTLLQSTSLPPEPQPGKYQLDSIAPHLHAAISWILLAAWATVFYYHLTTRLRSSKLRKNHNLIMPLLFIFGLAFFMAWSPVNFWQFLPKTLWITQFTYRILSHVMWSGALLVACALVLLFNSLEAKHLVLGILLISIAHSSYLPKLRSVPVTVDQVVQTPDLGNGSSAYLYDVNKLDYQTKTQPLPGLVDESKHLRLNQEQMVNYSHPFDTPVLRLNIAVPQGWAGHAVLLLTFINGQLATSTPIPISSDATAKLSVWLPFVDSQPVRLKFVVQTVINKGINPPSTGEQPPQIRVEEVPILQGLPPDLKVIPVKQTQPLFKRKGERINGQLAILEPTTVQLPFLYFPDLLTVTVDGRAVPYAALPCQNFALVSLKLPKGLHKIRVQFVGLRWANWLSALTVVGILAYTTWMILKNKAAF